MQGRKIAAIAAVAAAAAASLALADSCESEHVAILAKESAPGTASCAELSVRIAQFNASCPMRVPELDCG